MVLGNQGLIGRAQLASNTMAEGTRNEMRMMNEYEEEIDRLTGTSDLTKLQQYFIRKRMGLLH